MATGSILALDLAETTGWAIASPGAIAAWPLASGALLKNAGPMEGVLCGSQKLSAIKGRHGIIYVSCFRWLQDMIKVYAPSLIVVEAPIPQHKSQESARRALGLSAIVDMIAEAKNINILEAHVSTVRKHFAGSGHAKKDEVLDLCRSRGWKPKDHNAADALAVLDFAICNAKAPTRAA